MQFSFELQWIRYLIEMLQWMMIYANYGCLKVAAIENGGTSVSSRSWPPLLKRWPLLMAPE